MTADFIARTREDDPRVSVIERGLLAAQLGTTVDDLDLLDDAVVTALLNRVNAATTVIGASRLLEKLDAHVARQHPVDLEWHGPITTATVPYGEDDVLRVVLEHGKIYLPFAAEVDSASPNPTAPTLTPDDAEDLAHALLRLVQIHRSTEC